MVDSVQSYRQTPAVCLHCHFMQKLEDEPGIHWSQMLMQSGTIGFNTLRMYSPTKQAKDQDPQADLFG